MKKTILLAVCLCLFLAGCYPQAIQTAETPSPTPSPTPPTYEHVLGIRPGAEFGMTENDIKNAESYEVEREFKGEINYKIPDYNKLFGFKFMSLAYLFNSQNQMIALDYGLSPLDDKSLYTIDTYDNFIELISSGEGEPTDTKMIWSDKYYESQPDNWGKAFSMGHYKYAVYWENDAYKVIFTYSNDGGGIQYQTKKFQLK